MGWGLISINRDMVYETTSQAKSIVTKGMNGMAKKTLILPDMLMKDSGRTNKSIRIQAKAESEMMNELSTLCDNFANSINMSVDSFCNKDSSISNSIIDNTVNK